ncbi:hypothetical protein ABIE45_003742 [Methylobacterium sp. OAE515]|jgi:hypothetical protein|uniref:hypothetical protein n=1 Tax=Methylobacterium sp. OAE515 TaxID=2817895 RepID=UPI00178BE0BC
MSYAPATRQTIRLDEGDVTILLPADLSRKSIGILQTQLEMLAAGLGSSSGKHDRSCLQGLAELAAYVADR